MTLEQAREILKGYLREEDGSLVWPSSYQGLEYLNWWVGSDEANLDGEFTADQLEAVVVWMRAHPKKV